MIWAKPILLLQSVWNMPIEKIHNTQVYYIFMYIYTHIYMAYPWYLLWAQHSSCVSIVLLTITQDPGQCHHVCFIMCLIQETFVQREYSTWISWSYSWDQSLFLVDSFNHIYIAILRRLRPVLEGIIVTLHEGMCEQEVPMSSVWTYFSSMPSCIVTTKPNRLVWIMNVT